jgi:spore germination protein KB
MLVFRSSMENAFWGSNVAPIFSSFFEYLMPAFTLLAAYLRKLHRKAEAAAV